MYNFSVCNKLKCLNSQLFDINNRIFGTLKLGDTLFIDKGSKL